MSFIFSLIITIVTMAAQWKLYQKMGYPGWKGIIPGYNMYILFDELYGNGWKLFMLLIPFYGIWIQIKLYIDLAHAFNKSTGFGIGLWLVNVVFYCILAFSSAYYLDGGREAVGDDVISRNLNKVSDGVQGNGAPRGKDPQAIEKLKELNDLYAQGILSEEEFQQKKAELLSRI